MAVGIVVVAVLVVTLEGALGTGPAVVAAGGVAIVDGEHVAVVQLGGHGFHPVEGGQVNFGAVAGGVGGWVDVNKGKGVGQTRGGEGIYHFLEG